MTKASGKYNFFYRNSLTIVFVALFIFTLVAQALSGLKVYNQELLEAHKLPIYMVDYLTTGHFISATFENFESEFLQMALYVLLTIKLRQIGSSESKSLTEKEEVDQLPVPGKNAPWPVKKGGLILKIYENSLSICFLILFFTSWTVHFYGSWQKYNLEQSLKQLPQENMFNYLSNANFWFETFQNWQSEFISVAAIVFFSIYLRQKGSPESKPVAAPHTHTGR